MVSLGNTVVLDLDYEDGLLWVLGEDQRLRRAGGRTVAGTYTLGRNYLKGCSFGGDGFALLLLGRYQAGSAEQAVIVGPDGTELALPGPHGQCAGTLTRRGAMWPCSPGTELDHLHLGFQLHTVLWTTRRTPGISR